jgi:superfamily I DNA/RNA helicase
VRTVVESEVARIGRGTVAVIAADPTRVLLIGAAAEQGGDLQVESLRGLAGLPVEVHTPVSAKGLEFDAVVIVDPERIRAHHPADLYVSMTRATQRLGLLHVEG